MTPPNGPSDPNAPYGQHDPNAPTEQFPPYPPYPPYPPAYPGAAAEQPHGQQPYGQSPYGPPPYGQPPYGQPYGAYPAYPGYPPPMPQKSSNRTLWIVLGVVGGVLLLACISCVVLGIVISRSVVNSPIFGSTITATEFCTYEEQQDYASAYNLFSPNLQSQMTQDAFVSRAQELDTENGVVTSCTPAPSSTAASNSSATFTLTVVRGGDSTSTSTTTGTSTGSTATTTTGDITLVNSGGSWQIDSIDQSLGLM